MTVFYDHLLDLEALDAELQSHVPDEIERTEVLRIVDATLHHVVMNVILQALPADQHELFLVQFGGDPTHPEHLAFLRRHHPAIEDAIREAVHASKRQFIDTIHA